jgi:hypothetical protein
MYDMQIRISRFAQRLHSEGLLWQNVFSNARIVLTDSGSVRRNAQSAEAEHQY